MSDEIGIDEIGIYAKLIAASALAAALAAGAWYCHHAGYDAGVAAIQAKWDKAKADQAIADNAAILARVKNNERVAAEQQAINQQLKDDHAKEIAQIRSRAAADSTYRLRLPATVCREFAAGASAQSASGSTATTAGTVALPEQTERNLRELMIEADTVVANCRATQKFIIENKLAD